ncbi:hypothetical protein [Streptomyces sp. NBC_00078]|uniref:hypothetical protein n=1 Tax=unclassified Streptomyces TaxID=2593676 RepID=UPI0022579A5B|nr:hypothetical protein [Streptomyces sp. NBC_00078]MCX5425911.1 hypothetical protein [Streptomyces sp. NBC_00078]
MTSFPSRRRLLVTGAGAALGLGTAAATASPAAASTEARRTGGVEETRTLDELYLTALAEGGKLVIYAGGDVSTQADGLRAGFKSRFPGIDLTVVVDYSKYHDVRVDNQVATDTLVPDVWIAEYRWQRRPLREAVPNVNGRVHQPWRKSVFTLAGKGTWSSAGHLPLGALSDRTTGRTWLWQLEANGGGGMWECGECVDSGFLSLSGPSNIRHGWSHQLEPGAGFTTIPVALALAETGGIDEAFAGLTRYRRAIRRPHPDLQHLPVIFNDYMNCLMGDPTTERLLHRVRRRRRRRVLRHRCRLVRQRERRLVGNHRRLGALHHPLPR